MNSSVLDCKGHCCPDSLPGSSKYFSAKLLKVNSDGEREHFKGPVMLSCSFLPVFSEGDVCCQPVSQPKPGNEKSRSRRVIFIV